MTTRPVRTRWIKQPAPLPEEPRVVKAKHLPMFGPGIVITVPLHLWIEYAELYDLQPVGIREPKVQPERGPGEAIFLVRRTPKQGKEPDENAQ
jgi:hypothetical protein